MLKLKFVNKGYNMKKILVDYVIRNKKNFIIILVVFCIGIVIGSISINNLAENQKVELNKYIEDLVQNIKNSQNIDRLNLLILSIKQNVIIILLVWFLGCTIIGGVFIYIAIFYKGFSIGYTVSALISVLGIRHGAFVAIFSIFIQNLIFIPAFFLIAENGIKLYKGIYKKCINLKEEVIRHSIIMFISIMLSIISSFVEVYFSINILIFLKEII